MNIKFLRPLNGASQVYPQYNADDDIVLSITKWCNKILLAGNHWDLNIDKKAVYQLPSTIFNVHTYVISIDIPEIIVDILAKAKRRQGNLEKEIGIKLDELEIVGGVLTLNRKIYYDPEESKKGHLPYNPRRFTVGDTYWLDVYVRKTGAHEEEVIFPILTIYPSTVTAYSYRLISKEEVSKFYDGLAEYFPEPDDIIVDWHELSQMLGLERSRLYLQACLSGIGYQRRVWAAMVDPWVVIPEGQPNRVLIYGQDYWPGWGQNLIGGWGGSPGYTMEQLADPQFLLPMVEIERRFGQLWIDEQYVRAPDDSWVLLPPTEPWITPYPSPDLRFNLGVLSGVSSPPLPNNIFGQAVIKLLMQASEGGAAYLGEGLFRVKADSLTNLAAGSGNWGSAEVASVVVFVGAVKVAGETLAGGGAVVAIGAGVVKRWKKEDIEEELEDCYTKADDECITCVENSLGYQVNTWQEWSSYIAFGGAALAIATGGGIIAVIGIAAGVWGMIDSAGDKDDMLRGC